jgi:two-component system OmpR family response regulator
MILKRRAECAPWTARHLSAQRKARRGLVVDDHVNPMRRRWPPLFRWKCRTRLAFGGIGAIRMATGLISDVIVMDISMPECNGFEAALALRHGERTHAIAIIAFSALDEIEVRRHLADHEFDGYCQNGQSHPSAHTD